MCFQNSRRHIIFAVIHIKRITACGESIYFCSYMPSNIIIINQLCYFFQFTMNRKLRTAIMTGMLCLNVSFLVLLQQIRHNIASLQAITRQLVDIYKQIIFHATLLLPTHQQFKQERKLLSFLGNISDNLNIYHLI